MDTIKSAEKALGDIAGASAIKSKLSKARRAIKKDDSEEGRAKAAGLHAEAVEIYQNELSWRAKAKTALLPPLQQYDGAIATTIGLRSQERLNESQAKQVALCQSHHRDISLNF